MSKMPEEDTTGALERARARLYAPEAVSQDVHPSLVSHEGHTLPHAWEQKTKSIPYSAKKHMRLATVFFTGAFVFFVISLGIAGYFLYYGNNAVSIDKVSVDIQGPSTIAGGDIVPLVITVTNKNTVAVENATIEIDFPAGTRNAEDVQSAYPRYTENIGKLASGESATRSVKVILFGGTGDTLNLPTSLSYETATSNAVFVKKSSYSIGISSTPLSVSVDAPTEIVAGKPFTITMNVRSSTAVPLTNVVLSGSFPFGFSATSSSIPLTGSSFLIGTLAPNAHKIVTLTGTMLGQDNEQRVFRFTVGTAKTSNDSTLAVTYLTQDATIVIAAPFISTVLSLNGDSSDSVVVTPGSRQSVTVSYTNTLPVSIANASISITLSGSAIDYNSIQASRGFYRSTDNTIVFDSDTDPSLASLAPGASGVGVFTFSTLPANMIGPTPTLSFSVSSSGTQAGQTDITYGMSSSVVKTVKVATSVALSSQSLHSSGVIKNIGPIPPSTEKTTTYTVQWTVQNFGSAIAGGVVTASLPTYVVYTDVGPSGFSYDKSSRIVTWSVGDIAQGGRAQGSFQVSITPSTSQKGTVPVLAEAAKFSGYDRFAGVKVSSVADPVTTETRGDEGYVGANAIVVQ